MLSVVIPVYNERGSLPQLTREIETALAGYEYEVVWVEDESDDGSKHWLDQHATTSETDAVVHLKRGYGQSTALAAGIDHATGDVIVTMDADLQNHPEDIPRLVEKLNEGYDCVSGWRRERNDPWHKTIPSAVQTRLAKLTGPEINDFGCTLTAYRADAIREVDLYGERHRYIPSKLHDLGYSVTEVEVAHRPREHGESRYGVGRLLRGFVDLLFHLVWVRYSTRPMHLLGGAGVLCMGAGTVLGVVSVVQRYVFGVPLAPRTPRLVLVAVLLVFGLQLVVFGVLMEFLTELYYRDEAPYRVDEIV